MSASSHQSHSSSGIPPNPNNPSWSTNISSSFQKASSFFQRSRKWFQGGINESNAASGSVGENGGDVEAYDDMSHEYHHQRDINDSSLEIDYLLEQQQHPSNGQVQDHFPNNGSNNNDKSRIVRGTNSTFIDGFNNNSSSQKSLQQSASEDYYGTHSHPPHPLIPIPTFTLKILICGAPSTGKTTFLDLFERRFQKYGKEMQQQQQMDSAAAQQQQSLLSSAANGAVSMMGAAMSNITSVTSGANSSSHHASHSHSHHTSSHNLHQNIYQPSGTGTVAPQFVTYPLESILSKAALSKLRRRLPRHYRYNVQFIDAPHSTLNAPYLDPLILNQVHGAALVFDISDPKSIYAVDQWRKRLYMQAEQQSIAPLKHILLIANKAEKKPHILSPKDLSAYIRDSHYIKWYMTSAKWKNSVEEAFEYLIVRTLRFWKRKYNGMAPESVSVSISRQRKRRRPSPLRKATMMQHYASSGGAAMSDDDLCESPQHMSHSEYGTEDEIPLEENASVDSPQQENYSANQKRNNSSEQTTWNGELFPDGQQVEELVEQSPFNLEEEKLGSPSSTGAGSELDPDSIPFKIQATITFRTELYSFYTLLRKRLNEYVALLDKQQKSFDNSSFSTFCLTSEQVRLILSELKHEQDSAEDKLQNILQIYQQTDVETLDRRCKKQFAELKRSFYIGAVERWSSLWHSMRTFMFLHNNVDALQQGEKTPHNAQKCKIVGVIPSTMEDLMKQMGEDHFIIQSTPSSSSESAASILKSSSSGDDVTSASDILKSSNSTASQEASISEEQITNGAYNFQLLNQALDVNTYHTRYSSIHAELGAGEIQEEQKAATAAST